MSFFCTEAVSPVACRGFLASIRIGGEQGSAGGLSPLLKRVAGLAVCLFRKELSECPQTQTTEPPDVKL